MMLLLMAQQVDILEQVVSVRPADWQSRRLTLRKPGAIDITYEMTEGGAGVRLVLIARDDESNFARGRVYKPYGATAFAPTGRLQAHVGRHGDYSLLLDNRLERKQTAAIKFRGMITYDVAPLDVRTLPWQRKLVVIASSLTFFSSICFFAGRRLWRAVIERRMTGPPEGFA